MEIVYYEDEDYTDFIDVITIDNDIYSDIYMEIKVSRHNSRKIIFDKVSINLYNNDLKVNIINNPKSFANIDEEQLKEKIISAEVMLNKEINSHDSCYDACNFSNEKINTIIKRIKLVKNFIISKNISDSHDYVPKIFFHASFDDGEIPTNICEKIDNVMKKHYIDNISFDICTMSDIFISKNIKFNIKMYMDGFFDKNGNYIEENNNISFTVINNFNKYINASFSQRNTKEFLYIDKKDFISYMKKTKLYHDCKWFTDITKNQEVKNIIEKTFEKLREEYLRICAIAPPRIKLQSTFYKGA